MRKILASLIALIVSFSTTGLFAQQQPQKWDASTPGVKKGVKDGECKEVKKAGAQKKIDPKKARISKEKRPMKRLGPGPVA